VSRPAVGPRSEVQSPKSGLRSSRLRPWTLDLGLWTLTSPVPTSPTEGPKGTPYCVRGQAKPQRHRLTACAGRTNPKRHPLLCAGFLKTGPPSLTFRVNQARKLTPRPASTPARSLPGSRIRPWTPDIGPRLRRIFDFGPRLQQTSATSLWTDTQLSCE
jgi:hypothetical protein